MAGCFFVLQIGPASLWDLVHSGSNRLGAWEASSTPAAVALFLAPVLPACRPAGTNPFFARHVHQFLACKLHRDLRKDSALIDVHNPSTTPSHSRDGRKHSHPISVAARILLSPPPVRLSKPVNSAFLSLRLSWQPQTPMDDHGGKHPLPCFSPTCASCSCCARSSCFSCCDSLSSC